ncbi:MAG: hypothetical protein K2J88_07485 [Oscillospiraceae bacterium]|nr:hypothetical protein [Oscillospiraceae bacterium]
MTDAEKEFVKSMSESERTALSEFVDTVQEMALLQELEDISEPHSV